MLINSVWSARTIHITHAGRVGGNLLSLGPLDIVSGPLECPNHLLGADNTRTGDKARNLGGLATIGIDNAALVGGHVHVLHAESVGHPSELHS